MNHTSTKSLVRRVDALENTVWKTAPHKRNVLLDISTTAIVLAWTPDEIEEVLAAVERSKLDELPAELRRRWVRQLDGISLQRFGRTFGALLASAPTNSDAAAGSISGLHEVG